MKIALLNLQYDSNYGGNLQRYALMKVLQDMGHDVTHLNLRSNHIPSSKDNPTSNIFKRLYYKLHNKNEYVAQRLYEQSCKKTDSFYDRYIKHTIGIYSKEALKPYEKRFDAFIVGSDQVWRKAYASHHGISTFFFDFLPPQSKAIKIAYGASFGTENNEFSEEEIKELGNLYKRFNSVSVREISSLKLLEEYHWNDPRPVQVLDPTLLLDASEYIKLTDNSDVHKSSGNLFCYILDSYKDKEEHIKSIATRMNLTPFRVSPYCQDISVEQWLKSFIDADYVITDSYHGILFSIILHKPFYLFPNESRGAARFQSLFQTILKDVDISNIDWDIVDENIQHERKRSFDFLMAALSSK